MLQPPVARSIDALQFENSYVDELPGDASGNPRPRQTPNVCYARVQPTPTAAPTLLMLVPEVAALLELDVQPSLSAAEQLANVLGGNHVLPGMKPFAACYGGHQFGNWAGQLGDGRAMTLSEVRTSNGELWEMQLKGAGLTPYSRTADGRAVLRSSLRELVASEAMHHLGVPTTRALSLVTTGDEVLRDMLYDGHPRMEPGAVVCRVAPSFLRFGHVEIHASRDHVGTLKTVVDYTLRRLYPEFGAYSAESVALMFAEVCRRTAVMVVEWMRVGFVHGVMNTDNMSMLGLSLDYGPYGFIEPYDLEWTPNTTDAGGKRYRFGNQPRVAVWNLVQLGNALLSLDLAQEPLEAAIAACQEQIKVGQHAMMLRKLGLSVQEPPGADQAMVSELENVLAAVETDMALFYRRLAELDPWTTSYAQRDTRMNVLHEAYYAPDAIPAAVTEALHAWLDLYGERTRTEGISQAARVACMNATNPMYVPRNYLLQLAIDAAEAGDRSKLAHLMDVLRRPYEERAEDAEYAAKRPEWARHRAGCSMLSCSS